MIHYLPLSKRKVGFLLFVLLIIFILRWQEKAAALRGTRRKPLSKFSDKSLRLLYLLIIASPALSFAPKITLLFLIPYAFTFIDGSEKKLGRTKSWYSKWQRNMPFFAWLSRRLNLKLVSTSKIDKSKSHILCLHPHGILPLGGMGNLFTDFSNVKEVLQGLEYHALAASFCFYMPGIRDIYLAGGVVDASRYVAQGVLASGKSLVLVPGGASEALYSKPGVLLKKRFGFITLAMETGASLVPVYSFGETDTYDTISDTGAYVRFHFKKKKFIFFL
eukprot:GSMAST32.ASY1.ANO1.2702.1 assembled CDS